MVIFHAEYINLHNKVIGEDEIFIYIDTRTFVFAAFCSGNVVIWSMAVFLEACCSV